MNKYKKGFTILELLVVVAIIGILSAIVLGALGNSREKARDSKRIEEMKSIQTALELYRNTNGKYPAVSDLSTTSDSLLAVLSPYIKSVSNDFLYTGLSPSGVATSCTGYHLVVTLEHSNTVLSSDKDKSSRNGGNLLGGASGQNYRCGVGGAAGGINGSDTGTSTACASNAGAAKCYDLAFE